MRLVCLMVTRVDREGRIQTQRIVILPSVAVDAARQTTVRLTFKISFELVTSTLELSQKLEAPTKVSIYGQKQFAVSVFRRKMKGENPQRCECEPHSLL